MINFELSLMQDASQEEPEFAIVCQRPLLYFCVIN